jgi:ubiquitin carboxyl-terminal hydrolase 8
MPATSAAGAPGAASGKVRLRPLYLGKSIEELNKQSEVSAKAQAKQLLNSLPKLKAEASKCIAEGDQEKAYILYMKYVQCYTNMRNAKDFKEDPGFFNKMLNVKEVKDAVVMSENLCGDLSQRYEKQAHAEAMAKEVKEQAMAKKSQTLGQHGGDGQRKAKPSAQLAEKRSPDTITPKELYSLMDQKATALLLLDCRPATDFAASCIRHAASINVPADILRPGCTPKAIEANVSGKAKLEWQRRMSADVLVLYDWFATAFDESQALIHLRQALTKWDHGVSYKCQTPRVLSGGYDNFLHHYPMKCSDAAKGRQLSYQRKKEHDQAKKKTVDPAPIALTKIAFPTFDERGMAILPTSKIDSAVASGAVVISQSQPIIPDRTTKPGRFQTLPPSQPITSAFASTSISDESEEEDFLPSLSVPVVDRSSKAKALLSMQGTKGGNSDLCSVLEAENDLVEQSLELERTELNIERHWEALRLKREREAEGHMRDELIKREEKLLDRLRVMAEDKKEKELENNLLRRQLQELKQIQQQSAEDEAANLRREQMIQGKEIEKQNLKALVDKMRRERKRTEMENTYSNEDKDDEGDSSSSDVTMHLSRSNLIEEESDDQQEEDRLNANLRAPPIFDRTAKPCPPSNHSQPQLMSLPGNRPSLTGLRNLGNTCYMNSILQSLTNFTLPSNYFIKNVFARDLNKMCKTRGEVAKEYAQLARLLWSGQHQVVSPDGMKLVAGKCDPMFSGCGQQDAHEFFSKLMEWLHDELNEVQGPKNLPERNFQGDLSGAQAAWEFAKKADRSFIIDTFYGQWVSTLTCQTCGWQSAKYDPFMELTIQLPTDSNHRVSFHEGMMDLLKKDRVEYNCELCKRQTWCTKQLQIVKFPLILSVHFVRFYQVRVTLAFLLYTHSHVYLLSVG